MSNKEVTPLNLFDTNKIKSNKNKALELVSTIWCAICGNSTLLDKVWKDENLFSEIESFSDIANKKLLKFLEEFTTSEKETYLSIYYTYLMQGYMSLSSTDYNCDKKFITKNNNLLLALSPNYAPVEDEWASPLRYKLQEVVLKFKDSDNYSHDETISKYFEYIIERIKEVISTLSLSGRNLKSAIIYSLMYFTAKVFGFSDTIYHGRLKIISKGETIKVYCTTEEDLYKRIEFLEALNEGPLFSLYNYKFVCEVEYNEEKDNFIDLKDKLLYAMKGQGIYLTCGVLFSLLDSVCTLCRLHNNPPSDWDIICATYYTTKYHEVIVY